jgi:hypothetical protein
MRTLRALMPRHPFVVIAVLALAAVAGYGIKTSPQAYLESATIVFSAPGRLNNPASSLSLITSGDVMVQELMSPEDHRLIRGARGTGDYSLALVNYSDEEYADYSYPFATLTAESTSPYSAHRTFLAALQQLRRLLVERQDQVSAPSHSRMSIRFVGDSGATTQAGSSKRVFAALTLLAVIAVIMISSFLDLHRDRPYSALTSRPQGLATSDLTDGSQVRSAQRLRSDDRRARSVRQSSRHRARRNT